MPTIDDMIDRFDGSLGYATNSKEICQYIADLLKELKERRKAPEIVHCKDCKKRKKCFNYVAMRHRDGGYIHYPLKYCSEGERRTDERRNNG